MSGPEMTWIAQSTNVKTGNIPQGLIGRTEPEARASCAGCPLLHGACYAWSGTPAMGARSAWRARARRPDRYTLAWALAHSARTARAVRVGAIGDPGALAPDDWADIQAQIAGAGLALVGYTHHWRRLSPRRWSALAASCESMGQADQALSQGWRIAAVITRGDVPAGTRTSAGIRVTQCPATQAGSRVTCNECQLCSLARGASPRVIAFPAHGPRAAQFTEGI